MSTREQVCRRRRRFMWMVAASQSAAAYSAQAQQFFDRITDPGATRKTQYATLIDALVAAGVWSKLDALWIFAADISGNAVINLKSSNYTCTLVNSPTFTQDRGFTGDGSTNYIRTGFVPSTAGGQWTLNSAHMGFWCKNTAGVNGIEIGGRISSTDNISFLQSRQASDGQTLRVNQDDNTGLSIAATNGEGHFVGRRSASNALAIFRNATSLGTGTNVSQALTDKELYILALNNNDVAASLSSRQVNLAHIGASLTDQNITDLYNALNTYMTAVGAA